jgi:hypothetical protein
MKNYTFVFFDSLKFCIVIAVIILYFFIMNNRAYNMRVRVRVFNVTVNNMRRICELKYPSTESLHKKKILLIIYIGLGLWGLGFNFTFNNISAIFSFIGGENRSTRRKPSTCGKSLINLIT